jgi:steroid 5-alpha reductase family enzyme
MRRRDRISIVGIVASILVGALVTLTGSQGSVEVGSVPVFAVCGALAFIVNWIVYVPSAIAKTEHYFDLTGSVTYVTVVVVSLAVSDGLDARAWIVAGMVVVWALRLGNFLFRRVRRDGRDGRFDAIKLNPLRFLMTWTLQGLWVLLTVACALAVVTSADREPIEWIGVVGIAIWMIGFAVEVVADRQKSAFRLDPANRDRFLTSGLWAWSRHPNYFGEITLWVGVAVVAVPILSGWRWVMLISPLFVILLLTRISGIPLLEARAAKRWRDDPGFQAYTQNTPALIPRPPRRSN